MAGAPIEHQDRALFYEGELPAIDVVLGEGVTEERVTVIPPESPVASSPFADVRFTVEEEISQGGIRAVHTLWDNHLRRHVARKALNEEARAIPRIVRRFLEEAQITGQLDHPNIVPVHDISFDESGAPTSFTMKLARGRTLAQVLDQLSVQRLEERNLDELLRVLVKVCEALSFAHSRGVVHCDLRPANILLAPHGQVYLMDWGLAIQLGATGAHPEDRRRLAGTPAYMAPEQASAKVELIDIRTDTYGLGALLYNVLTGMAPHSGTTTAETVHAAQHGRVIPPAERVPDRPLPPELCRMTQKAMDPDPAKRYQTARALRDDLERALQGGVWFATRTCAAGTMIVRQGDPADAAYVIMKGLCDVVRLHGSEQELLRRMGPGEVFGETAVLTQGPRTATVVAATTVMLKVVTRDALERELARNTWLRALVRALAERFIEADEALSRRGENK